MDRKNFIKSVAAAGLASCMIFEEDKPVSAASDAPRRTGLPYDLVAVMGGEPEEMFRRGIKELGGMEAFVKKGQKVTIKPNMAWARTPEFAANTNPDLIAEIIKACYEAGAAEVTVFDHGTDDWQKSYELSQIEAASKKAGAKVIPANELRYYREVLLPRARRLKSVMVHQAILDADVWFNVPVLKTHGGARMTVSMKNLMGIIWNRATLHRNNLQQCIADLATLPTPPTLNIVDAYRIVKSNGPRGLSEEDVATPKALFFSSDMVAVDTAATKFFSQFAKMTLSEVSHIAAAEKLKVGTTKLDTLRVQRIKM